MVVRFLKNVLKVIWDNFELFRFKLFCSFLQMYDGVHFLCVFNCLWKAEFSSQPISEYWNRMTTLIPSSQAIKHFCNFIPSYFMERFAFLIEGTSYILDYRLYCSCVYSGLQTLLYLLLPARSDYRHIFLEVALFL